MNLNEFWEKTKVIHVYNGYEFRQTTPRIYCKDGFNLSVQVGENLYCAPRRNHGPYRECEVGYPSADPELIAEYAQDPAYLTNTVYPYVPVELVEQLIELHGGIKEEGQ